MKIRTKRNFTFEESYIDSEQNVHSYTVTFDFPYAEQKDYRLIKSFLSGKDLTKSKDDLLIDESQGFQLYYNILRQSLVGCTGFEDEEGKDLIIKDSKTGKINENIQLAVFEFIHENEKLMDKIQTAYKGVTDIKN